MSILKALEESAADHWTRQWQHPAILRFLRTGDSHQLAKIPALKNQSLPSKLLDALFESTGRLGDPEARFIRLCVEKGLSLSIGDWLISVNSENPGSFDGAVRAVREVGATDPFLAVALARWTDSSVAPNTPGGRLLLGLSKDVLIELIEAGNPETEARGAMEFFSRHAPETMASALTEVLAAGRVKRFPFRLLVGFLDSNPGKFASLAERGVERCTETAHRFALLQHLTKIDPQKYGPMVDPMASGMVPGDKPWCTEKEIVQWLIEHRPEANGDTLRRYFAFPLQADPWARKVGSEYKNEAL